MSRSKSGKKRISTHGTILGFEKCEPRQMLATTWQVGDLNFGVASSDRASGLGYMMFTQEIAATRFDGVHRNNAERFVPVRHAQDGTPEGQWQYNNNRAWLNFDHKPNDLLVAQLNFTDNTAISLENVNSRVAGIQAGYDFGDIAVIAGVWNETDRPDGFTVTGTAFTTFTSADDTLVAGQMGRGVAVPDASLGKGYLLYTAKPNPLRFRDMHPYQAEHFFAARQFLGQWQYATNEQWIAFQPSEIDLIVAELDFEADSVELWKGISYPVANVAGGFDSGDITITGGQWNGMPNPGEFQVFGSYMHRYDKHTNTLDTSTKNEVTIAANSGYGYMLYTVEPVASRFSGVPSANSQHFVGVRQDDSNNSQWQFNNGNQWVDFQPRSTDALVATLDFANSVAIGLKGTAREVDGVALGYADGDITFSKSPIIGIGFNRIYVQGTFIQPWSHELTGDANLGVHVMADATGYGYLLYSQHPVQQRFAGVDADNSTQFVAVMNDGVDWFFNDGSQWIEFAPAPSDRLVATIDFADFEIDGLTYLNQSPDVVEGIMASYRYGDLHFSVEFEDDKSSRYQVLGTHMLVEPVIAANAFEDPLVKLGEGILEYNDRWQHLPQQAIYSVKGEPLLSWRVAILPYVGYQDLYHRFDRSAAWDSPQNLALLDEMPAIYQHPELIHSNKTVYQVISGDHTAFPLDPNETVQPYQSDTLFVVEADPSRATEWTRPLDLIFSESDPLDGLGGGFGNSFDAISNSHSWFDVNSRSSFVVPASIDSADFTRFARRYGEPVNFDAIQPFEDSETVLRAIGLAAQNMQSAYQRIPARASFDAAGQPLLSWRVHMLPFLGYQSLASQFNYQEAWDSPHNIQLLDQMPRVFDSPGLAENLTNYFAMVGEDTAFPIDGGRVTLESIKDVRDHTVLFVEGSTGQEWSRPIDINYDESNPGNGLGYSKDHATHLVVATGATKLIDHNISDETLGRLIERNDEQEVDFRGFDHYADVRTNLRSSAISTHNYHDTYRQLPGYAVFDEPYPDNDPLLSWRVAILPYLGYQNLFDRFNVDEPWDSQHNLSLLPLMPREFAHPLVSQPGMTNFQAVVGQTDYDPEISTVFPGSGKKMTLEGISNRDGTSATAMYVEANAGHAIEWTRPGDIQFDNNNPWFGLGEIGPTGFHTAFADGSVRFTPATIDDADLLNLLLFNDGQ